MGQRLAESNHPTYDQSRADDTSVQIPGQWLASRCSLSPTQHLLLRRVQMDNAAFAVDGRSQRGAKRRPTPRNANF